MVEKDMANHFTEEFMAEYYGNTLPGITALSRQRHECHFKIVPKNEGVAISLWAKDHTNFTKGLNFLNELDRRHPNVRKFYSGSHGVKNTLNVKRRNANPQRSFNFTHGDVSDRFCA